MLIVLLRDVQGCALLSKQHNRKDWTKEMFLNGIQCKVRTLYYVANKHQSSTKMFSECLREFLSGQM